jgi:hypothetical protein
MDFAITLARGQAMAGTFTPTGIYRCDLYYAGNLHEGSRPLLFPALQSICSTRRRSTFRDISWRQSGSSLPHGGSLATFVCVLPTILLQYPSFGS